MMTRKLMLASVGAGLVVAALGLCAANALAQSADGTAGTAGAAADAVSAVADALSGGAAAAPSGAAAAAAAGLSPAQVAQAKQLVSQGGLPPDQMQKLCANIAARHMTPEQVDATAASMGISGEQVVELKNCAQGQVTQSAQGPKGGGPPQVIPPGQVFSAGASGPLSSIEASFRTLALPSEQVVEPTPANLRQFGYNMFSSPVSTFAPVGNVPVGPDYILGPGDGLNILMWGRVNRTLHVSVERDGAILVPEIGPLEVAGLTFEQAKKLIESRAEQITGVDVDVTMGSIRTIGVFVIGKVNRPGMFTVSALSHVSNALVAAGGISKIGSLRRIELRRGNQVIRVIDLYDMLLRGDTSSDVRLEQGDVLFVPVIGAVVGISGSVKDPAIYELKGNEDLRALLRMAGGVGAFGYSQRLQVERVSNHTRRIALDIALTSLRGERFQVLDGDLIKVFTVLPERHNIVTLKGNVHRPGVYEWHPGMRVSDLVAEGERVADHTFFDYALIQRTEGPDRRIRFLPVDLGAALSGAAAGTADIALQARDELTIYNEKDIGDLPKVSVAGAIRKPGSYPLTQDMRVSDLIYEAGGLNDNAFLNRAQLVRTEIVNGAAKYIYQDINLNQVLDNLGGADLKLRRGDRIVVQEASNWHTPWTVLISGEAMRPGPYVIFEGERFNTLLEECGGLRSDAYLPATVFIRQSVKRQEQERLDESRRRLQAEAARISLMPRKAGTADTNAQTLDIVQRVLADNQALQAVGRIVLHLNSPLGLHDGQDNLILENGDSITIPKRPAIVAVLGQVFNPSAIVWQRDRTVGEYLQKAGGPTEYADNDHVLLIRANGEVVTDQSVRHSGKFALFPILPALSGGLMGVQLEPGDTIYVPENLNFVSPLQYATDITQVLANSVMSLAVIGILGASL